METNNNFHDDIFNVQILTPPFFTPSGRVIDRREAWKLGEWYGTFNLWIVQRILEPCVIYQLRSPDIGWAPGKLDVAVAGHYEELEGIEGGLREIKEELNADYKLQDMINLGRRLNVGIGQDGTKRNTVSDLYLIEDNSPLEKFTIQERELYAICSVPLSELIKVHEDPNHSFKIEALKADRTKTIITVDKNIFPPNWDNYHYKMAMLIDRYFKSEKNLIF